MRTLLSVVYLLSLTLDCFLVWSIIFHMNLFFCGGCFSPGILCTLHCMSVTADEQLLVCLCWAHHLEQGCALISELWVLYDKGRSGASVSFFLFHLEPQEERQPPAVFLACGGYFQTHSHRGGSFSGMCSYAGALDPAPCPTWVQGLSLDLTLVLNSTPHPSIYMWSVFPRDITTSAQEAIAGASSCHLQKQWLSFQAQLHI